MRDDFKANPVLHEIMRNTMGRAVSTRPVMEAFGGKPLSAFTVSVINAKGDAISIGFCDTVRRGLSESRVGGGAWRAVMLDLGIEGRSLNGGAPSDLRQLRQFGADALSRAHHVPSLFVYDPGSNTWVSPHQNRYHLVYKVAVNVSPTLPLSGREPPQFIRHVINTMQVGANKPGITSAPYQEALDRSTAALVKSVARSATSAHG